MSKLKKLLLKVHVALGASLGAASIAGAQVSTTTPGTPTTAMGGYAGVVLLLLVAGLILAYLGTKIYNSSRVA